MWVCIFCSAAAKETLAIVAKINDVSVHVAPDIFQDTSSFFIFMYIKTIGANAEYAYAFIKSIMIGDECCTATFSATAQAPQHKVHKIIKNQAVIKNNVSNVRTVFRK